ncbi:MAG: Hsp20/alpha crystallin family protein, partial [Pseudomonadota bacterium]
IAIAELPGADQSTLKVIEQNAHLYISAGGSRPFETTLEVPVQSDTARMSHVLKNGILTITIPKKTNERSGA